MTRSSGASAFFPFIAALLIAAIPAIGSARTAIQTGAVAPAQAAGLVLEAKIATSLSSRNAKADDVVKAKTLRAYKLADGTDLPKGSTLIGKVALARSKKDGNGKSMLTFRFDQVEAKDGAVIPIHGLVVAIGPPLAPHNLFGANNVMNRDATGMPNVLDPNTGLGSAGAKDEDDIPMGSTLPQVALGRHMDADWTTALEGIKTDIELNSDVRVKVQLK